MVLEGTLGITASHFLLDFLREREQLPGFVDGYGLIAADEQRHIAYGTWFLREAVREDESMADVIRDRIKGLLPAVAASISPPSEGAWDLLGWRAERSPGTASGRSSGACKSLEFHWEVSDMGDPCCPPDCC